MIIIKAEENVVIKPEITIKERTTFRLKTEKRLTINSLYIRVPLLS